MAGMNNRMFGEHIDVEVRKKLEMRQSSNGEINFGNSVKIEKDTELSSKLPFVRMWTSLKIIQPGIVAEDLPSIVEFEVGEFAGSTKSSLNTEIQKALNKAKAYVSDLEASKSTEKLTTQITAIYDKDGKIEKVAVKGKQTRDQTDFVRKVYEVGNYTYQENYGTKDVNESLNVFTEDDESTPDINEQEIAQQMGEEFFPQQLKTNPLMKPQAGITSISSETEGMLGVIKKTTVNFRVNNFYDFDRIYNKYFLRPGAQIFVDFGWSDIENLYRPEELIDHKKGTEHFLYNKEKGETEGRVTRYRGDFEVIQGIVTDYNAKINPDGTVDCSVTLTSSNQALLSFKTDDDVVTRVKSILTRGILYLGIRAVADTEEYGNDLKQLTSTPNVNTLSPTELDTLDNNLKLLARKEFSGDAGPKGNSIRTGVFVDGLDADNSYIAWGLFEDFIVNTQFGFGKSGKDINEGNNFEVRMDSSNSFTKFNELQMEKQKVLSKVPDDAPIFMFPEWWCFQDPEFDTQVQGGSYSYQVNKWPERNYETHYGKNELFQNKMAILSDDKLKFHRIPLREIFVSTATIVSAFEQNDTVKKAVQQILDDVNEDSQGLFNWSLFSGKNSNSQIQIIDKNYTNHEELQQMMVDESQYFTFKVQSPNSLVKDYNLDFKIPTGNVGNMYAVQGMSHGNSLFSIKDDVDAAVSTIASDKDSLSVIYEPDVGSHRLEQLLDRKNNSEDYDVFKSMEDMVTSNNVFKPTVMESPNLLEDDLIETDAVELKVEGQTTDSAKDAEKAKKETTPEDRIARSDELLQMQGYKVANSFKEYYDIRTVKEEVHNNMSNLLPYNLSLTIFGISSIVPGDIFKVDYLPKKYFDNTYLQTMKVSHEIGPGGWYTTLDTQFRLKPGNKTQHYDQVDFSKVRLSPKALQGLGLEEKVETDAGAGSRGNDVTMTDLSQYMTDLRIESIAESAIDYSIYFRVSDALGGELEDESGRIKNIRGNFLALFGSVFDRNEALNSISPDFYSTGGAGLGQGWDKKGVFGGLTAVGAPDIELREGDEYEMAIHGTTYAIFDLKSEYYSQTKQFFSKYVGGSKSRFLAEAAKVLEDPYKYAQNQGWVDQGSNAVLETANDFFGLIKSGIYYTSPLLMIGDYFLGDDDD